MCLISLHCTDLHRKKVVKTNSCQQTRTKNSGEIPPNTPPERQNVTFILFKGNGCPNSKQRVSQHHYKEQYYMHMSGNSQSVKRPYLGHKVILLDKHIVWENGDHIWRTKYSKYMLVFAFLVKAAITPKSIYRAPSCLD